jgi:formate hydrogenlyase transcriptional activator
VERAVIRCDGDTFSVEESWLQRKSEHSSGDALARPGILAEDKRRFASQEKKSIEAALASCEGRVSGARGAAAKLGIPPQTLDSKIASLGIDKRRFKMRAAGRLRA